MFMETHSHSISFVGAGAQAGCHRPKAKTFFAGFQTLNSRISTSLVQGQATSSRNCQILVFGVSASHAKPDIRALSCTMAGPVPGVFASGRTSLWVITVACNVMARAQMKAFGPYAGVG